MGDSESENVIPIRPESHDDDTSPLSLRDVVLLQIEIVGTLFNGAPPQTPPDKYLRSRMCGLICALADAGMPFDTWKDEVSDEALAGLRRLKVDLRPELGAVLDDAMVDVALQRHPDWSKTGDDWEYHGDENTPHLMNDVIDWFRRHYPHEAREIEQRFTPPADSELTPVA